MNWLVSSRLPRWFHYAVILASSLAILFFYYSYKHALPAANSFCLGWFWDVFYFEYRSRVIGILLLFPILYAAVLLSWKRSLIIIIALLICVMPYIVSLSFRSYSILSSLSCLVLPPALIISTKIKLIADARERAARDEKRRERAEFIKQLFSVQEDERKRISQELHDGVAQTLLATATTAHSMLADRAMADDDRERLLESIKQNSLDMVAEIRCICQDLRPNILDNLGLVSAIRWLVDSFSEETGISVSFSLEGQTCDLNLEENVALFRIVQETLNNIKRHAGAKSVQVIMRCSEAGLSIQVRDDGKGFELADSGNRLALDGKLGILGMNERSKSIGARLEITSGKGTGTLVEVSVRRTVPANVAEGSLQLAKLQA